MDEYRDFFVWLKSFNDYISTTGDRSVALLLCRVPFNGTEDNLPILKNASGSFLPANTASFLQPMDAGITASIKGQYHWEQVLPA